MLASPARAIAPPTAAAGDRIAGRYDLVQEIGAGGMGTVFRAIDARTGDLVALKLVRVVDPTDEIRFEREAAALAGVADPAVVRYFAHGRDRGAHFLVMAWLDGHTLDEHLTDLGLAPAESVRLVARVAAGLGAVHRRGLVHRDIKPRNLMLVGGAPDAVTILDFGVARPTEHGIVTNTGRAVGTPGYMSPEQTRGERTLDARSDVFSLGCVLYECLTGRAAFPGEHPTAVCTKILVQDPPPIASVWPEAPRELVALVDACLAKAAAGRPADGAEVARRFATLPPLDPALPRRLAFRASATQPVRRAARADAVISIVLARPPGSPLAALAAARRLGASADLLADGTLLVELADAAATHHAAMLSAVSAALGPCAIAVAAAVHSPGARDDVIERAARELDAELIAAELPGAPRPPRGAIRADGETVGLLAPPLSAILDRVSYLQCGPTPL